MLHCTNDNVKTQCHNVESVIASLHESADCATVTTRRRQGSKYTFFTIFTNSSLYQMNPFVTVS